LTCEHRAPRAEMVSFQLALPGASILLKSGLVGRATCCDDLPKDNRVGQHARDLPKCDSPAISGQTLKENLSRAKSRFREAGGNSPQGMYSSRAAWAGKRKKKSRPLPSSPHCGPIGARGLVDFEPPSSGMQGRCTRRTAPALAAIAGPAFREARGR